MNRVAAQARAVLLQFQFFGSGLATNGVVVIASFFAHEKYRYDFLLALGHGQLSTEVKTGSIKWGHGFYERFVWLTSPKIGNFSAKTSSTRLVITAQTS